MKKLFVLYIGLCLPCISAFAQLQQADGKQSTPPGLLENILGEYDVIEVTTFVYDSTKYVYEYTLKLEEDEGSDSNLKFRYTCRGYDDYVKANTKDGINFEFSHEFDIGGGGFICLTICILEKVRLEEILFS